MNRLTILIDRLNNTGYMREVEVQELQADVADTLERVNRLITAIQIDQNLPGYLTDMVDQILAD